MAPARDLAYVKAPTATEMRRQRRGQPLNCAICGEGARLIAAEKAATISRISRPLIYSWIDIVSLQ